MSHSGVSSQSNPKIVRGDQTVIDKNKTEERGRANVHLKKYTQKVN
jgi:hypothetical protein